MNNIMMHISKKSIFALSLKLLSGNFSIHIRYCLIGILLMPGSLIAQLIPSNPVFEPDQPPPQKIERHKEMWRQVPAGLIGSFGDINVRYDCQTIPKIYNSDEWSCTGWRGERVHTQIVLWTSSNVRQVRFTASDLLSSEGNIIGDYSVKTNFIRYVIANDETQDPLSSQIVPDIIDPIQSMDIPSNTVRSVWVSIDIPNKVKPGIYTGTIIANAEGDVSLTFNIKLKVSSFTLPPPSDWSYHLDLWQNPYSVARYHRVKPWSQEHWILLKPVIQMLADAGQKCITTTITHDPWLSQTYDPYESMVKWIKNNDGSWSFDYSIFDQYVKFCMSLGITKQINCYSLTSWGDQFRYFDEKSGNYRYIKAKLGTNTFDDLWSPFLKDFVLHLKKLQWIDITAIAADEMPLGTMQTAINFIKKVAPELKIALAGNAHFELKDDVYDYCTTMKSQLGKDVITQRANKFMPSTFYVCCGPEHPNTFTNSPPAEATWLGWYAANKGFTGFLRWAYNSWVADPLYDTRFGSWTAGDCFMVYPGGRSSIRFERLREGIQDFEKIRIIRSLLKNKNNKEADEKSEKLERVLSSFEKENLTSENAGELVRKGKQILQEISSD
jgi:hypothetical protein